MNASSSQAAVRPIREGLFQLEPPRLLGSRCSRCATVAFPGRSFCPRCFATGAHEQVALSTEGTIFSYTVVRQAPAGWNTPYVLAYVDLPEQVRVLAQVDVEPDRVRLGLPVQVRLYEAPGPDGEPRLNFRFAAESTVREERE